MSGLTPEGFVPETIETLRAELAEDWQTAFGASIDVSDESPDGILLGILADRLAVIWELLELVIASQDPDAATGAVQDAICALTGTIRLAAAPTTVTLTLTGTPDTVVPAVSQAETASTTVQFDTDAEATLVELDAWTADTPYLPGDRVTNADRCYVCTQLGTSAGSGGPTSDGPNIGDGTAAWRYLGEGTAAVDVEATATVDGPLVATSGDVTEIVTPVAGWEGVINLLDAEPGRDQESHEDLRIRREDELGVQGASIAEAIRSEMLDVDGVTDVTVFQNTSDETDGNGLPPHSVEIMVRGGEDQDVADQVWASVAAGIVTYGTEEATVVDSEGTEQTVYFTRPEEVEIHIEIDLTIDPEVYSPLGVGGQEASNDLVAEAIVAYGDTFDSGDDVRAFPLGSVVIPRTVNGAVIGVPGVHDVIEVRIDTETSPTTTTPITITLRQIAVFDSSRISVQLWDLDGNIWPPP
jgi:uncharacterized phage protein gp47/JayE